MFKHVLRAEKARSALVRSASLALYVCQDFSSLLLDRTRALPAPPTHIEKIQAQPNSATASTVQTVLIPGPLVGSQAEMLVSVENAFICLAHRAQLALQVPRVREVRRVRSTPI